MAKNPVNRIREPFFRTYQRSSSEEPSRIARSNSSLLAFFARSRTGHKEEAAREFEVQKQAIEKQEQAEQRVRQGIAGALPQP